MNMNSKKRSRLPLAPRPVASLDCLVGRADSIHDVLMARGFSDAVACRAVDESLDVGERALSSGKAQQMTPEQRAGWLWRVAVNAARRAAKTEPDFVVLNHDPADIFSEHCDEQREALYAAIRKAVASLPHEQERAVVLRVVEGLTLREAARELGVRPSTFEYRCRAGLERLGLALKARVVRQMWSEKTISDSGARAS